MSPQSDILILGVPTEAGTHFAGQTKAPKAIIESTNLPTKLSNLGYKVSTQTNILDPPTTIEAQWRPSPKTNGVRNEAATLNIMHKVHDYISAASIDLSATFPIVLGGDCSISPAIIASLSRSCENQGEKLGVLYFDGDADLTLPSQTSAEGSSGILDSMVLSHLTQRPGGLSSVKTFSKSDGSALVDSENIVLFGFDPLQPSTEHWTYLLENQFRAFTRPTVQQNPVESARKALDWLGERVDRVFVHFDVDVIDSGVFPLANYPHYAGLGFEEAMAALEVFLGSDIVCGMCVTEVNPNNAPQGRMVGALVDGVVEGFRKRARR